ncbi:hepatocellular carcinoma-associated antigen 59-domain-containing protein [Aspergillus caelatus]|uniref:Hepatocellular carcinoma-associated antigen 59-domain-containing protein n=1 Tax=Aspergillus caelatus TaxID=61420 RepID=A0A5N7A6C8_9EURO|nr:hepatocellular carcinoma-associated antigen 59-domain-containing protein [Aspergillus caelatus]KAE8365265.1 hepatocellular carcinoma-associated antigen 59-domain-containing protein [Aspergillus caelatus]
MDNNTTSNPETLFRPVKRRKFLRRRPEDTLEDFRNENRRDDRGSDPTTPSQSQADNDPVHPTDLVRLRRLHRFRKGGIGFSTTSRQSANNDKQAIVSTGSAEDLEAQRIHAMCDRFTAHTGQTVDVDKHMMAYIETEMAKRHQHTVPTDDSDGPLVGESGAAPSPTDHPQREPASLGKLHEIDLGQETKLQNIARTEAATRKLARDDEYEHLKHDGPLFTAAPMGKDERLWRRQKRRTSEDVERDRLVEEVLRESKRKHSNPFCNAFRRDPTLTKKITFLVVDVYEEPEYETAAAGDDQAADDRVAEQFRRDFLDAIQSRRRVTRVKNPKTAKTEASRGPKLGGSRSARAAMREMQEKQGRK